MLEAMTPRRTALTILAITFVTIAGAWIFEYFGYAPCELCLKQRWAYYAGIPLAAAVATAAPANARLARMGLWLLAILWAANAMFGVYHAGIEWKWWAGPSSCTGGGGLSGLPDLGKPVVMCDEASLRIFGLSLAGWNGLISAGLAVLSWRGAQGSSSVSQ